MGKLYGVLLAFLFVGAGCVDPATSDDPFGLSESELKRLSLEAMGGSGEAAEQIAYNYYTATAYGDRQIIKEWYLIAAENESHLGRHRTAGLLAEQLTKSLTVTVAFYEIPRCTFWMRLDAKDGDEYAKHSLESHEIPLDFDFPPDSSFPDSYTDMSAGIKDACEEGALKGSGKAALLLAKYYSNTVPDAGLEAYWYRIGAQNGDPECQYNLALIYTNKSGKLNWKRGTFWHNKAIENGYTPYG